MSKQAGHQVHTTTHRYNGSDYPIIIRETVRYLAKHILTHNKISNFTQVTLIGHSGSGKSTCTSCLTHALHTTAEKLFGKTYAVNWFRKSDIESLDKIIASFEKGINRIIIFEDASFAFEDMDQSEVNAIMQKLTYIRHTLQANIILIIQMHYSKALERFLRDGAFKIVTSISDEEVDNYLRLFGYRTKFMLNQFARKYYSMNVDGFYYANAGMTKIYKYWTKEPFKVAMISELGQKHFMHYFKPPPCPYCEPNFDKGVAKQVYDATNFKEFATSIMAKYKMSHNRTASRLLMGLRYHIYYHDGIDQLSRAERSVTHKLVEYFSNHPDDYKGITDKLTSGYSLEGILREIGLVTKKVSRQEEVNIRRAQRRKASMLRKALEPKPVEEQPAPAAT